MNRLRTSLHLQTCMTTAILLVVCWLAILGLFHLMPHIDIALSAYFFKGPLCVGNASASGCGSFIYADEDEIRALRRLLYILPYCGAVAVVFGIVIASFGRFRRPAAVRPMVFALLSLALGVGLIVNGTLKEYSGRPRPVQTTIFGGNMEFAPAGSFDGTCPGNCSFVSGEAAGAGWLICLIFLVPPRWRKWAAVPIVAVSVTMAALRVVVGAHFTSDAILGWLVPIILFCMMITIDAIRRPPPEAVLQPAEARKQN